MKIDISFQTATELMQIDRSELNSNKENEIHIKKMRVLVDTGDGNKKILETPYYTGNSFRGKLRRICTELLLKKAAEKGISLKNAHDSFNLMNAGGGNNYQSQSYEVEAKVRELNPVVSVFGASLAITGKINTSSFMPYKNGGDEDGKPEYYYAKNSENGSLFSTIIFNNLDIKADNLIDRNGNAKYMPEETIKEWASFAMENAKEKAAARGGDAENKVTKETIKNLIRKNFIIRGVDFFGSIQESKPLTQIERGMIHKAIEILVMQHLGANQAKGFGLANYSISCENADKEMVSSLETNIDKYLTPHITKKEYPVNVRDDIAAFEKWLDEITEENILIENTLIKTVKAEKKEKK
jgi:CRISPR type IV-associated protein Csf2